MRRRFWTMGLVALCALPQHSAGQVAVRGARTGLEVELHGVTSGLRGGTLPLRGVAYEVQDAATLRPLARARVRVWEERTEQARTQRGARLAEVQCDEQGRFRVEFPARTTYRVEVVEGNSSREVGPYRVELAARYETELISDRILYEPGETMNLWALVRSVRDRRPQRDVSYRVRFDGLLSETREGRTSASGIAHIAIPLPRTAESGDISVRFQLLQPGVSEPEWEETRSVTVGRRTSERMFVQAQFERRFAAPGDVVNGTVTVTAPDGSPVRGARVLLERSDGRDGAHREEQSLTDERGVGTLRWQAPAMVSSGAEYVSLRLFVVHPSLGEVVQQLGLVVASAPMTAELLPATRVLPIGIASTVFVVVRNTAGGAPPEGTPVEVSGLAIPRGTHRGTTDRDGVVVVPVLVPADAVASHRSSSCSDGAATTLRVALGAEREWQSTQCARVDPELQVVPSVRSALLSAGEPLQVTVQRRPEQRNLPVQLSLLRRHGRAYSTDLQELQSQLVEGSASTATMTIPRDETGLFWVRARIVRPRDEHASVAEGVGASVAVVVRPSSAFGLQSRAGQERYRPREEATIQLQVPASVAAQTHAALLVRDEASVQGETPFVLPWIREPFGSLLEDPTQRTGQAYLQSQLALLVEPGDVPEIAEPLVTEDGAWNSGSASSEGNRSRGDLRDPFLLRDEFLRRQIGRVMNALERGVTERVAGVVTTTGRAEFAPDALRALVTASVLEDTDATALGGGALTLAHVMALEPTFRFDVVARRVARAQLVRLLRVLKTATEVEEGRRSPLRDLSPDRWLSRLVELGVLTSDALRDPWRGSFVLRRLTGTTRGALLIDTRAAGWELVSPGPDGIAGNADDLRDPFARVVPAGTTYAAASREEELLRALASLDPAGDVLTALVTAYTRENEQIEEERRGDLVTALDSEGDIGVSASMSGTGTGSGFGAGAGSMLRSRSTRAPMVRAAAPVINRMATGMVREWFPATLLFRPELSFAADGTSLVRFPVADAITTWRAESIAWTDDGWSASSRTLFRVDRDAVVDAPVPAVLTPGDRIELPLRVRSRLAQPLPVQLRLQTEGSVTLSMVQPPGVTVPANDGAVSFATLTAEREGQGFLRMELLDAQGQVIDQVRRPLRVEASARRVRKAEERLFFGTGSVSLQIPSETVGPAFGRVRVQRGIDVFAASRSADEWRDGWGVWAQAMAGRSLDSERVFEFTERSWRSEGPVVAARVAGSLWASQEHFSTALGALELVLLSARSRSREVSSLTGVLATNALFGLIPAFRSQTTSQEQERSPEARARLANVVQQLRTLVLDGLAEERDPGRLAMAAAAVRSTSVTAESSARELWRRATRLLSTREELPSGCEMEPRECGAMFAFAAASLGDLSVRDRMLRVLHTAPRPMTPFGWAVLRSALSIASLDDHAPLQVLFDQRSLEFSTERSALTDPAFGAAGTHVLRLPEGTTGLTSVLYEAHVGRSWTQAPERAATMELQWEGTRGVLDQRSEQVLVLRSRTSRVLQSMRVQVELPAGAELEVPGRMLMERAGVRSITMDGRLLTFVLPVVRPGSERRIPVPVRWTVAGTLRGLAVAAYTSDSLGAAVAVLPPQSVQVPRGN